jgi:tetraacyldisaccharide 4'-kinase
MGLQIFIEKHLYKRTFFSYLLYPFSIIYATIVLIKRQIYKYLPLLSFNSKFKIISIGNITTGGAGKTPVTLYIAKQLIQRNYKIAIVLRGYKGKFEHSVKLISDFNGVYDFAKEAGDEAYLYTQKLSNIPVCVGKNRRKSIQLLESRFPEIDYIIMDDAFQHLKIKVDFSICVFNSINLWGNGFCLPAGILREPFSVLKYADSIILNGSDNQQLRQRIKNNLYFIGGYKVSNLYFKGKDLSVDNLQNSKNIIMSGIGTPKSFENTVISLKIPYVESIYLNDHFDYSMSFIEELKKKVDNERIDYIIITEKDYSKVFKINLPFVVVKIDFILDRDSEEKLLSTISKI